MALVLGTKLALGEAELNGVGELVLEGVVQVYSYKLIPSAFAR